ncbi:agmatine deiminase family protein [Halalkalibacter alkaliphilus]|uniref:Agmatine deiminase family protein n=1 Tax=Halalkalibacter alkaliphilus TaxID=2917993 RepID=A0A9X2I4J9_9BACI|nr:agmatine deiminase family protein [Halalkalibacter alkaliphilus]MCL7747533.1 agmatine deiminase family protein [Halalkalibacter alkaliphilus]
MYPKELNYKMPAEWTTHQRTFISWPVQDSMVYPDDYEHVWNGYAELVHAIAEFEPVSIVTNRDDIEKLKAIFVDERVGFLPIEHNDAWLRDNGPTFVKNADGDIAGINWIFNAWGEKYSPWKLDNDVAPKILEHFNIKKFDAQIVMEGGSFHVDGEGTVLTTEECLLNPNRNPDLSKEQVEQYLKDYLNIEKVIWLNRGLSGDETDGHVDNVACFAEPGKVIMQVCHDPSDDNYQITQENLEILRKATDAKGRKFEVIEIEQPPASHFEESRLTLSYLNFYFVNDGIILPVFGNAAKETDQKAIDVLQRTFPDRRIRTIDGMAIIKEGGNVHCTTQQMPAEGK